MSKKKKQFVWVCEANWKTQDGREWGPWFWVGVNEYRYRTRELAEEYFTKHNVPWVWIYEDPVEGRLSPRRIRFRKYEIKRVKRKGR